MTDKLPPHLLPYAQFLKNNKCGNCAWLEKGDGFSYCMLMDLYTERGLDDEACESFVDRRADDGK